MVFPPVRYLFDCILFRNVSLSAIGRFFLFIKFLNMFNQIYGSFREGLKAFVTDTALVVCLESLLRPELAAFFA
jgi:hypothetical protein